MANTYFLYTQKNTSHLRAKMRNKIIPLTKQRFVKGSLSYMHHLKKACEIKSCAPQRNEKSINLYSINQLTKLLLAQALVKGRVNRLLPHLLHIWISVSIEKSRSVRSRWCMWDQLNSGIRNMVERGAETLPSLC